jgi:hypothetical protein
MNAGKADHPQGDVLFYFSIAMLIAEFLEN